MSNFNLPAIFQRAFEKSLDKTNVNTYTVHVTEVTNPCGPLAQSVEHLTFNQGVPRSSRGWITIFFLRFYTSAT